MPILEIINDTAYRISLNRDTIELGDITSPQCLAHMKVKRWHGKSEFVLSYPGSPTGLVMVDMTNGILKIPYGDVEVELTAHDVDQENPDGRSEFNVILKSKPTPDVNGDYWQVLDFDSTGLNFERVLGLDEEWSQERCYEEWYLDLYDNHLGNEVYGHDNGTGIFVRTPTEIRTPDGQWLLKSKPEHLVHSLLGTAIKNTHKKHSLGKITANTPNKGKDLIYANVSRDHARLPRRELIDAKGKKAWIEDVQLVGNQIKFKLPKDFIEKAKYPVQHVTGVDPAYTEDMDSWVTDYGSDETWGDYDIFTNHGVPKGAVAEVIIANQEAGYEADLGIRTDGSSLARKLWIHEAEGDGVTTCRMFVLCDASTGLVETHADDVSDVNIFYLVGYWENVGFTERWDDDTPNTSGSWQLDETLSVGAGAASLVCHMVLHHGAEAAKTIGVRGTDSALERKVLVHEAEGGGYSAVDMLVKADANNQIDMYADSSAFILNAGYFGEELDFVELFQSITHVGDSSWDAENLTAYLDQDGRVVDFLLGHESVNGAPLTLGIRDGDDAATNRYIPEHEAEWTGDDTHEVTGFGISAKSNASGVVNLYSSTAEEVFYLMGYFKPTAAGGVDYPISLSPGLTASVTVAYKAAWDRGMSPGLTATLVIARALTYDRGTSPGLTVSATIAKSLGRLITTTANLTVSSTVARYMTFTRAMTANLTASATVAKSFGKKIATTANLVVSTTIAMSKGFVRAVTSNLTASTTVDRAVAYNRASTPGLTVSATVDRNVTYTRATQPALSVAVSIVRAFGKTITTATGLTVSATIVKSWGRTITTTAGLTVSATVSRVVAWNRVVSSGLTVAVTVAKSLGRLIATNTALAINVTVAKQVAYKRSISAGITTAVSVARSWGRTKATTANLSISTTINRVVAYKRAISTGIDISVVVTAVKAVGTRLTRAWGIIFG